MHARKYTISNLFRRLGQTDDPWADISKYAQSLAHAEKLLDRQI